MKRLPWEITPEMYLSTAEVEHLVAHVRRAGSGGGRTAASARLDELIILTLLLSGVRTSEFCHLKIADTVVVTGQPVLQVKGSQSGGQGRTVYVPALLNHLILEFVTHTRSRFLPENVSPDDIDQPLVFSERKRPYGRTGLYRRVKRILTEAGLGDRASVQLLRHTYGYLAYKNSSGNLLFVQRQLGHAHPMITSVYAKLVDESYELLAEQIICHR